MHYRLRQLFVILLCAALAWTPGEAAPIAEFFQQPLYMRFVLPRVRCCTDDPAYFTEQAIVQRLTSQISPRMNLSPEVSLGALYLRARNAFQVAKPSYEIVSVVTGVVALVLTFLKFPKDPDIAGGLAVWTVFGSQLLVRLLYRKPLNMDSTVANCGVNVAGITLRPDELRVASRLSSQAIRANFQSGHLWPQLMPPELSALARAQMAISNQRGGHSVGSSIVVQFRGKDGETHLKIITAKAVNSERGDPLGITDAELNRKLLIELFLHANLEFPVMVWRIEHTRYSTSSDPTIRNETHPHLGEADRLATIYIYRNGRRQKIHTVVQLVFFHNGDFDGVSINGEFIETDTIKHENQEALTNPADPEAPHIDADLLGDTPGSAEEIKMRRAQYDAYAALRLARRNAVYGEHTAHHGLRHQPPKPVQLEQWEHVFESVIDALPEQLDLGSLNDSQVRKLKTDMVAAFERTSRQDEQFWRENHPSDMLRPVVEYAVDAFLHNDLKTAGQSLARDARTSHGVGVFTNIDPYPVLIADEQPMSIARGFRRDARGHKTKERIFGANSEARALTIADISQPNDPDPAFAYDERLDLDDKRGMVIELGRDKAGVWSKKEGPQGAVMSEEKAPRWFNLERSPYAIVARRRNRNQGAENDVQRVTYWLQQNRQTWNNPNSISRLASRNMEQFFVNLAKRQQREGLERTTDIVGVGLFPDSVHADLFVDSLKEDLPDLTGSVVDGNEFDLDPAMALRKHRISKDTLVLLFDFFGGLFNVGLTKPTWALQYTTHVFGITGGEDGDLDTSLARQLGQGMDEQDPPSGRVIPIGCPWPQSQARIIDPALYYQTLNYLKLRIEIALREECMDIPHPLGLDYTLPELQSLWSMNDRMPELAALTTGFKGSEGMDGKVEAVPSSTIDEMAPIVNRMAGDVTEPRQTRYLMRFGVLFLTLYLTHRFGWSPSALISTALVHFKVSPLWAFARALIDGTYYSVMPVIVLSFHRLRTGMGRWLFARTGLKVVALASPETHNLEGDYWRNIGPLGYPDAKFIALDGNSIASVRQHFLKTVKPLLDSGAWILNTQGDDRTVFKPTENTLIGGARMTATQSKVEKDGPWARFSLKLRRYFPSLEKLKSPTLVGVKVVTIGYHFRQNDPNASDFAIQLPTIAFPLPEPVEQFLNEFKLLTGLEANDDQRALLWELIKEKGHEPEEQAYHSGMEIATRLGVPQKYRHVFADTYDKMDGFLFFYSPEQIASYKRVVRFRNRRFLPVGAFLAKATLGLQVAVKMNRPVIMRHRRAPVGESRSKALVDSTASPVSAMLLLEDSGKPSLLEDISVPLLRATARRVTNLLAPQTDEDEGLLDEIPLVPTSTNGFSKERESLTSRTAPASAVTPDSADHSDLERAAKDLLRKSKTALRTSVIMKTSAGAPEFGVQGSLRLNAEGLVTSRSGDLLPEALDRGIQEVAASLKLPAALAKNGDKRDIFVLVRPINNRAAFFRPVTAEENTEFQGILVIDSRLIRDLMEGDSNAVEGVKILIEDELGHAKRGMTSEFMRGGKEELDIQQDILRFFLRKNETARKAAIYYWEHHRDFDPEEFSFAGVLKKTNSRYEELRRQRVSIKDARRRVFDEVQTDLKAHLDRVMQQEPPEIIEESALPKDLPAPSKSEPVWEASPLSLGGYLLPRPTGDASATTAQASGTARWVIRYGKLLVILALTPLVLFQTGNIDQQKPAPFMQASHSRGGMTIEEGMFYPFIQWWRALQAKAASEGLTDNLLAGHPAPASALRTSSITPPAPLSAGNTSTGEGVRAGKPKASAAPSEIRSQGKATAGQILDAIRALPGLDSAGNEEFSVTIEQLRVRVQSLSGGAPTTEDRDVLEVILTKLRSLRKTPELTDLLDRFLHPRIAIAYPSNAGIKEPGLWARLFNLFSQGTRSVMTALIAWPGRMMQRRRADRRREEVLAIAA